jgi:hypothetical protein
MLMLRLVILAVAATLSTTNAQASTLDFESQFFDSFGYEKTTFIEGGYRVEIAPTSIFGMFLINDPTRQFGLCGSAGCAANGTTAYYGLNETSISFSQDNGNLFSLSSLDAAQTFLETGRPLTLTLTGTKVDSVVTSTIFVDADAAGTFATFTFADFVGLSSLTITGSQEYPEFALDNVVLNAGAVPEPATWTMMIGGFGIVGGAMRRRRISMKVSAA